MVHASRILVANAVFVLACLAQATAAAQPNEPRIQTWRLEATPVFSVGGEPAGPTADLFGIAGAILLTDGRVVLADAAPRIMVLDSLGRHVANWATAGSGPGEFGGIGWIQRTAGDSVVAYDFRNGRVSVFDANGGHAYLTPPELSPRRSFVGRSADGRLVFQRASSGLRAPPAAGIERGSVTLHSYSTEDSTERELGTVAGGEQLVIPNLVIYSGPPLRELRLAIGPDAVFAVNGSGFEVLRFPMDEGAASALGRPWQDPIPLQPDLLLAALPEPVRSRVDNLPALIAGQTLPVLSNVLVDASGNAWVEHYDPDPSSGRTWSKFAPSNEVVAEIVMPSRFRPLYIDDGHVLGVARDILDVERLQLYRLSRSP